MKFNSFRLILISLLVVFLNSCLKTTDSTVISSNSCFTALTFASNDSVPYIQNAAFTLEPLSPGSKDSMIVNLDSLPYKTRIDTVNPTFTFKSSAAKCLFFLNGDSVFLTGTDTIDFNKVVKIRNYATDGSATNTYRIKVNVHQVKPEYYVWSKVSENLDNHVAISQKALIFNDKIYYYINDGSDSYLYTSSNGYNWSSSSTVNGLPNNVTFGDITQFAGKLYLTQNDDKIYTSTNGTDWTVKSIPDYNFKSLLFGLNGKLWAVTQSNTNQKYYFSNSIDGTIWAVDTSKVIPNNFPVNNFTALSFNSRLGKPKAIVVAAKSANGDALKSWSTEDGKYWVDFGKENKTLDTLAVGFSIIPYDDKLFVFGKRTDKLAYHFKISKDEGLSWQLPDTLYNRLRQNIISSTNDTTHINYETRNFQSVVLLNPRNYTGINQAQLDDILKSNRIFMIGGKSGSTTFSDVWTGKLNRKNFLRQ